MTQILSPIPAFVGLLTKSPEHPSRIRFVHRLRDTGSGTQELSERL